jgi:hypothetical protein
LNFGTIQIVDGSHQPEMPSDARLRGGLVRIGGALAPSRTSTHNHEGTTFVVDLNYSEPVRTLGEGRQYATDMSVSYSRRYKRLSSGGNPLKDAKSFVSQFAGCEEAHKLRKRIIAIAKTKKSISDLSFRFPLEAP